MRFLTLLLALFLVISCSTFDNLKKKRIDFENYQTYKWSTKQVEDNQLVRVPMLNRQVKSSVDQVLQEKGFILSDADSVDFYVLTYGEIQNKSQATNVSQYQMGDSNPTAANKNIVNYEEGTLFVEIIDGKSNESAWRNYGVGFVGEAESPEKLDQAMDKTIAEILTGFPPK